MVNVILEPQLVLPIFVPNMLEKKSRNGAMNSIALPTLQKRNHMQPIQHYSCYLSQYAYFMRAVPGMHKFIKPAADVIRLELLPALLNSIVPEVDRQLYLLPLRHIGLRIPILSEIAESQFEASQAITLSLVTIMITQGNTILNKTEVDEIKRKITNEQEVRISEQAVKVEQDQVLIP